MVYYHQSSVMFLRDYGDVFNIHSWSILCLLLTEWYLVLYLLSLGVGLGGNIIVFDHLCVFLHCGFTLWIVSIFCFEPWLFHVYNFEIVRHILFLLVDGIITYMMHTLHQWCDSCILPGSVGVACSPTLPVSCGEMGCKHVSSTCNSSSWWGCEY